MTWIDESNKNMLIGNTVQHKTASAQSCIREIKLKNSSELRKTIWLGIFILKLWCNIKNFYIFFTITDKLRHIFSARDTIIWLFL